MRNIMCEVLKTQIICNTHFMTKEYVINMQEEVLEISVTYLIVFIQKRPIGKR